MHALLPGRARSPLTIIDHSGKGCEVGAHTEAVPQAVSQVPRPATTEVLTMTEVKEGKEVYSTGPTLQSQTSAPLAAAPPTQFVLFSPPEEEDDLSVTIAPGTQCRRKGCSAAFASDAENRIGNGEDTVCTYHPAPVRFRLFAAFVHSFPSIDPINSSCSPSSTREARYVAP